jgi:hypothetical protein
MTTAGPCIPSGSIPDSKTCRFCSSPTHSEGSCGVEAGRSTTLRITVATCRQIWASDQLPTVVSPCSSRSTSGMISSMLP